MGLALIEPSRKFVDSLMTAYDVRLQQDAIALLSNKSVGLVKTARTDREGLLIFRWSPLFTDEEKRLVAAAFLGDELTVGEFAAEVDKMPRFARPMAGNFTQISDIVEQLVREEIFRDEFEKRKLRNQAWFMERMASKKEELMADLLFSVMSDTCAITEEEMKRYYEEHRDNFVTLTVIKLATIIVESEDLAKEISRKISGGKSFESVAVDFSVYSSSELGYDTTDFIPRSKWPSVYDAIWDKRIGEVAGPVYLPEDNVWVMAKLLARQDPRLLSFEEAVPMISERLKLVKADDAVVRLISELRDKAGVKIDYDALEKLELPEAPRH
jgi:peptidyl-prolyl cis-trans isomerase C